MSSTTDPRTRVGMTRKLLFLAFAVGLIALCVALLRITLLKVGWSIIFAAVLFAVFYWRNHDKPIMFDPSAADMPISKRILRDLHLLLIAGAIPAVALIRPGLFNPLMDAAWPFLGAAVYVFAISVYTLLRRY